MKFVRCPRFGGKILGTQEERERRSGTSTTWFEFRSETLVSFTTLLPSHKSFPATLKFMFAAGDTGKSVNVT